MKRFALVATKPHVRRGERLRTGLSLLELLAVLTIVGLLAAVALVNFSPTAESVRESACYVTKGEVELQVQLWHRDKGAWPQANLSDIGADPAYFPEGLPVCPLDGSAYTIDPNTHHVVGHTH